MKDLAQQISIIKKLFDYFNKPDERLVHLVNRDRSYSHFYKEYHNKTTLDLSTKEFELLMSKSSYRQIAIVLNDILLLCENSSETELLETYTNEIITIFSLNLWFNNFEYGIDEIFSEFPDFRKKFNSKVEKRAINMVTASSMLELFLSGGSALQEKILEIAIRENKKHISGSLDMSKKMAKMKMG